MLVGNHFRTYSYVCYLQSMNKQKVLKQFQTIPGIGKACSLDLWNL